MRASDHLTFNLFIGAIHGMARCMMEPRSTRRPPDIGELLFSGLASAMGAMSTHRLPDIIDPPTSPSHRDVGHGVVPMGVAIVTAYRAVQGVQNPFVRRFLEGAAIGPAGHLLADATTPAGVNLVRRGF